MSYVITTSWRNKPLSYYISLATTHFVIIQVPLAVLTKYGWMTSALVLSAMKTTLPVNVPIYGHLSLRDKTQVQRSSHANCWLHQNSSLGLWEASNIYAHGQFVYHTEICVSCCQWFSEIKFLYLVTNPVVCPVSVFSSFCYRNTFAW